MDYGKIVTRVFNSGLDKEASVKLRLRRNVLELRSFYSLAFIGNVKHTFEVVLWKGPACREGFVCLEEAGTTAFRFSAPARLFKAQGLTEASLLSPDLADAVETWKDSVVDASQFSEEEFRSALERL